MLSRSFGPTAIIMPGDTRRVIISGEGNGRRRRSNGRGNATSSERNRNLLIDFFQRNRRRTRAIELNGERRDVEERMRGGGGLAMRIGDDDDDGKKHSSFNLNFSCKSFTLIY